MKEIRGGTERMELTLEEKLRVEKLMNETEKMTNAAIKDTLNKMYLQLVKMDCYYRAIVKERMEMEYVAI